MDGRVGGRKATLNREESESDFKVLQKLSWTCLLFSVTLFPLLIELIWRHMPTLMELYCLHKRFRPTWSSLGVTQ